MRVALFVGLAGCGASTSGGVDGSVSTSDGGQSDAGPSDSGVVTDGGASDGGTATPCASYCASIQANCTAANVQYPSLGSCLGSCAGFASGAATGNTLECRAYHANAAGSDAATHCPHAGPAGDGVCGANCDGFCSVAAAACTGNNLIYASTDVCKTECLGFASVTARYNSTLTSGNSYACRMYHLSIAATAGGSQAATHCPHIKAVSAVCN